MSCAISISNRAARLTVLAALLCAWQLMAQDTVSSPPMGYVKLDLAGRTDNLISVPLLQEPVGIGLVLASTPNTVSLANVSWTPNQFGPVTTSPGVSYYAEISTGQLRGLTYPIVSNTTDTLVLNTGSDSLIAHALGAVAKNDTIRIRPYWTIGTIFGASDNTVPLAPFTSLPSPQQVDAGDSLLFFDSSAIGIEKPATARYVYVQSAGWRSLTDSATDQENLVLPPLSPILVRSHQATGQSVVVLGDAYQVPGTLNVPGGNGQLANDAFIALASSEPVSLDHTGLYSAASPVPLVFPTQDATQRQDLLLAFDPSRKGFDRPPEHTYYFLLNQGWREAGSASTSVGADVLLDPTRIYVLRKRANSSGQFWIQDGSSQ